MSWQIGHAGARRGIRTLFLGSAALFLVNIGLGIWNVFTEGSIPAGRRLAHLHAGTIGWITLSVIATAFWVYTGQRRVSDRYARWTRLFAWTSLVVVAGYVASFYAAFDAGAPMWLLPLFGSLAMLVIWTAFLYTAIQLRHQPTVTTVHLLLLGGLLVGALGATMGVLRGLALSGTVSLYPSGADQIGAHAGPMDMYLALGFAAIVEMLVGHRQGERWTRWGMTQMVLGVLGGFLAMAALYTGAEALIPLGMLAFLASAAIYLVRVGWRPVARNPFQAGARPGLFWGGVAFPLYIAFFVTFVFLYAVPGEPAPGAFLVAFAHVTFVGMATNLLLATHAGFGGGQASPGLLTAGLWLLNAGLVAFISVRWVTGRPDGAILMGLGVLLALVATARGMLHAQPEPTRFEMTR